MHVILLYWRYLTFLSVIHMSKNLPRTLWRPCLLAPGAARGILSAGPWHTWHGHFWTMLYTEYISSITHPPLQILQTKPKIAVGTMENHQRIAMNLYLKPVSSSLYSRYVFSLHLLQTLHKDHLNKWKPFEKMETIWINGNHSRVKTCRAKLNDLLWIMLVG